MFNWLDYLIIVFIVSGIVFGLTHGYKWHLYRLGCVLGAFLLAILLTGPLSKLITLFYKTENAKMISAFSVFLGVLLITLILGKLSSNTYFKYPNIDVNKMLGIFIGLCRNVILCSIIVTLFWILSVEGQRQHINESKIANTMRVGSLPIINKISNKLPGNLV